MPNDKEKTRQIIELLRHRHEPPEWASFEELELRTGHNAQRCDFFAINCWPSKKYWRVAYEIKVSRGDFSNEMNKPDKRKASEELANECFFVVPAGLLKVDEIPEGWGLIEKNKGGLRKNKHAKQRSTNGKFLPIEFVGALARRSQDPPPIYDEPAWRYQDQDLTYDQLMKIAVLEVLEHKVEIRERARAEILDSNDYKGMQAIRGVVRTYLGWLADANELEEWFNGQHGNLVDKKLKFQLERTQTALKTLLDSLA